jgi:hypothetical protein
MTSPCCFFACISPIVYDVEAYDITLLSVCVDMPSPIVVKQRTVSIPVSPRNLSAFFAVGVMSKVAKPFLAELLVPRMERCLLTVRAQAIGIKLRLLLVCVCGVCYCCKPGHLFSVQ